MISAMDECKSSHKLNRLCTKLTLIRRKNQKKTIQSKL